MSKMAIALSMVMMLAGFSAVARAAEPKEAIQLRLTEFASAWNQHDPKAMAAFWTEDGDLINPLGRVAKGRAEVEKLFADEQAGPMKRSTNEMKVTSVRMVGDVALVDATSTIAGMQNPAGNQRPPMKLHVFLVMTQQNGQWMLEAARPYEFGSPPEKAQNSSGGSGD